MLGAERMALDRDEVQPVATLRVLAPGLPCCEKIESETEAGLDNAENIRVRPARGQFVAVQKNVDRLAGPGRGAVVDVAILRRDRRPGLVESQHGRAQGRAVIATFYQFDRLPASGHIIFMRFAYYNNLSPARQRTYRKSDAITALGLPRGIAPGAMVNAIGEGLRQDRRPDVQSACQSLIDALTTGYRVPAVRVRVLATRPADGSGELHGLYEPEDEGKLARISVWMRTAQKKNVVAFKTFLRTLIH